MGDAPTAAVPEKKSRKSYSLEKKLKSIATAKRLNNIDEASQIEGVPRTCLVRWLDNEKKLKDASKTWGKSTKKLTQGRPLKLKEFDTGLAEWIKERRALKQKITYKLIMHEAALRLQKIPSGTALLKLSNGWRNRFIRRHRFTLRKPTSIAQKAPADYADKIVKFVTYTEQLRKKEKFKHVYGADETGIWLNPSGGLCVEQVGAKDVTILSSGNTKLRITVMLTACTDGTRMKPLVLMPFGPKSRIFNKTNEKFGKKLHLVWQNTTWMDNETIKIYLEKTFGGLFNPKRLLIWDAFKAHTSEDTKRVLKSLKPADVSWNKPFKAKFQALYDQWMLDGVHETTAAGNPKPPPPELYLEWVLKAWNDGVTKDNLINSFKACGIGAIGGADDHLIHCLKEGNGIPNGLHELAKAREAAEAQELAQILAGFEIEAPDEDDTGHVSDVEVVDDESAASGEDDSGTEDENHNFSDDSDF